jgi:hypothetical protein
MRRSELRLRELRTSAERGEPIIAVHYACEDLYQAKDRPAAIACVAVVEDGDETSLAFSLADAPPDIVGDVREVDLLERFYHYLQTRQDARIVHWNMNSATYGFGALATRYRYLTSKPAPYEPNADRLVDLDTLIATQFGEHYANHPKLPSIIALNGFPKRFFLKGVDEAAKFKDGDIGAVRSSVSEKVRMILSLFHLLVSGSLQTQTSVGMVEFASERLDAVATVLGIGSRFRYVERSLLRRHGGRSTIKITDEYDAQDLFRALLKIFFDDVRDEVWTPSYAGKSSRVDFVLPDFKLAVELKSTRATLNAASVGDQLIVDRDRYAKETSTNHLMCLVFDYDGNLENPRGMERDLERDATQEGLAVTVRIYDR